MTAQKYKLVSVKPTFDMVQRAAHAYDRVADKGTTTTFLAVMERALAAAIAAAPEPVCRFPSDDEIREFLVECQAGLIADIDDELLPLAREIIARFRQESGGGGK